jgi:signal transduction histidine kinase
LQGTNTLLEREPFELDEMIEEVVRDANFEGAVKQCSVNLQGSTDATVLGNRELLRSGVENVLRNAVRYSPQGAPVDVLIARAASGLEILIRDQGPGVPTADLERIFEPFYRVAESRDRDSGGEGIGLANTAQVMRAHGGSARAFNRPAGGFEVRLNLPETTIAV